MIVSQVPAKSQQPAQNSKLATKLPFTRENIWKRFYRDLKEITGGINMEKEVKTYRVAVSPEPNDGKHHSTIFFDRTRWFIIYEGPDVNAVKKMVSGLEKNHTTHLTMVRGNPKSIKPVYYKKNDETENLGSVPEPVTEPAED